MAATARQMQSSALPAVLPAPGRRRTRATPARRPAPQRRQRHGGRRLVGRTAQVVTHLPETGAVVGMCRMALHSNRQQWHDAFTRGLQALLDNGVLGVSASKVDAEIQALERRNAILKSTETEILSMPRVHDAALTAGMAAPDPEELRYLHYKPGDLAAAAQRLAAEGG